MLKILGALLAMGVSQSWACLVPREWDINDLHFADVVVVGEVERFGELRHQRVIDPALEPYMGLRRADIVIDITVSETLRGNAAGRISAIMLGTWTSSEPPTMRRGPSMIALRGPFVTVQPTPEPDLFTLLQSYCAGLFILDIARPHGAELLRAFRAAETLRVSRGELSPFLETSILVAFAIFGSAASILVLYRR